MGGGYYDRAVESVSRAKGALNMKSAAPSYSKVAEKALSQNTKLHKMMDPKRWGT